MERLCGKEQVKANCSQCPLRGMCYKGKYDRRTIEGNHGFRRFLLKVATYSIITYIDILLVESFC